MLQLELALLAGACGDLGLPRRRVAVCGLNPHAGEGGKIGTEEITLITPVIEVDGAEIARYHLEPAVLDAALRRADENFVRSL